MRLKQQEEKNILIPVTILFHSVPIPSMLLLIKTNKLAKKRDAILKQKWLINRQPGHSGHCRFVWDPPWGTLVLSHAVPAIDLIWRRDARLPPDQTQGS